jgi:hypothetical protein
MRSVHEIIDCTTYITKAYIYVWLIKDFIRLILSSKMLLDILLELLTTVHTDIPFFFTPVGNFYTFQKLAETRREIEQRGWD